MNLESLSSVPKGERTKTSHEMTQAISTGLGRHSISAPLANLPDRGSDNTNTKREETKSKTSDVVVRLRSQTL